MEAFDLGVGLGPIRGGGAMVDITGKAKICPHHWACFAEGPLPPVVVSFGLLEHASILGRRQTTPRPVVVNKVRQMVLQTSNRTLNSTQCTNGSQWSSFRTGIMCWYALVLFADTFGMCDNTCGHVLTPLKFTHCRFRQANQQGIAQKFLTRCHWRLPWTRGTQGRLECRY